MWDRISGGRLHAGLRALRLVLTAQHLSIKRRSSSSTSSVWFCRIRWSGTAGGSVSVGDMGVLGKMDHIYDEYDRLIDGEFYEGKISK